LIHVNETLPNAFEIFGVDFIVDSSHQVYLLEINSVVSPSIRLTQYPDFKQTGKQLTVHVVGGLFDAVTRQIVCPFFNIQPKQQVEENIEDGWKPGRLELVKNIQLRGNW